MDVIETGLFDDLGRAICLGDILESKDGYRLLVCGNADGSFYGSLICAIDDPCRNIPYALNNGNGHYIIHSVDYRRVF